MTVMILYGVIDWERVKKHSYHLPCPPPPIEPGPIAKSNIILDVKPWGDDTGRLHACMWHSGYMYCDLPIKRPWAFEFHGPHNGGVRLHGEAICTNNAYTRTIGSSKNGGGRLLGRIRYYGVHGRVLQYRSIYQVLTPWGGCGQWMAIRFV